MLDSNDNAKACGYPDALAFIHQRSNSLAITQGTILRLPMLTRRHKLAEQGWPPASA